MPSFVVGFVRSFSFLGDCSVYCNSWSLEACAHSVSIYMKVLVRTNEYIHPISIIFIVLISTLMLGCQHYPVLLLPFVCTQIVIILPLMSRCLKEYKQAVNIEKERRCYVIVALITECSRPADLKPYLYLDFIDQAKRGAVWTKLLEAISED